MLLAIATSCISAGCQQDETASEAMPPTELRSALRLSIQLENSTLSELNYRVTRRGQLVRSGTFLADGTGTGISALIGALESADQYILTLGGSAVNPQTGAPQACSAIAGFQINRAATTVLGVLVRCEDLLTPTAGASSLPEARRAANSGLPDASGQTSDSSWDPRTCARIDALRAVPGEAPVGKSVVLRSEVRLADGAAAAPAYIWSADNGVVVDDGAGRASFTCTEVGVSTILLTLSDSRPACGEERVFVYVTCFGLGSPAQPAGAGSRS